MKILLMFLLTSCAITKLPHNKTVYLENKTFVFESDVRTIKIAFDSTNCLVFISYKCASINKQYEKIQINSTYTQLNDSMVVIKNKLFNPSSELKDLTPPKEELKKCIINTATAKNKINAWSGDDGYIPSIAIDTIKVLSKRDQLFLFLSKRKNDTVYNFLLKEKLNK